MGKARLGTARPSLENTNDGRNALSNLRESLQTIYEQHEKLTAAIVVEEAKGKGHPLHSYFDWDNKTAGPKWRERQAKELIRSVRIKYRSGDRTETCRYFVSVQRDTGYVYEPVEDVAQDEILTEIVLRGMERDWRQLQSRYGHFKEFTELVRASLNAA